MAEPASAIILAAGLSRRMGAANKLLLPHDGVPILRRSVQPYLDACAGDVLVVTGHEADQIRETLRDLPVRFVHNPDYALGQKTSVATGLAAIRAEGPILIGLGDMPRITGADLRWLLARHTAMGGRRISLPVRGSERGNPLIIPAALRPALLADRRNPGCHQYTRSHPETVQPVPTDRPCFFHDIDTPADLAELEATPCGA